MKVDRHNPLFPVGTILKYLDAPKTGTGRVVGKPGMLFIITGFTPGVFQRETGSWSYHMRRCNKNGTVGRLTYSNAWNQKFVETSGRFILP